MSRKGGKIAPEIRHAREATQYYPSSNNPMAYGSA